MMQGDDIRNLRLAAQDLYDRTDAAHSIVHYEHSRNLALWVIAEQLFEVRALLEITVERKPVQIFVNGGEVTAKGE